MLICMMLICMMLIIIGESVYFGILLPNQSLVFPSHL